MYKFVTKKDVREESRGIFFLSTGDVEFLRDSAVHNALLYGISLPVRLLLLLGYSRENREYTRNSEKQFKAAGKPGRVLGVSLSGYFFCSASSFSSQPQPQPQPMVLVLGL